MRKEILDKGQTRQKLAQEQSSLGQESEETRRNLRAIEKNKSAEGLRARLTKRLEETATRIDDVTKQIVELDSKLAELRVSFKETLRDVKWVAPITTPST
jgi:predicted transcriptional regulator